MQNCCPLRLRNSRCRASFAIARRTLIGGAVLGVLAPRSWAQPSKAYRIAFVHSSIPPKQLTQFAVARTQWVRQFFEELRKLGEIEGENLQVDRYSGEGRSANYNDLADRVVSQKPDAIVTVAPLIPAFRAATTSIPIVGFLGDPISLGFVSSLARPGGNITGVSIDAGIEIYGKQLQILKEAIPSVTQVGYLATRRIWDSARKSGARCRSAIGNLFNRDGGAGNDCCASACRLRCGKK
jgi:putative tryptophan/tyrosine transport system substrate-binding protein